MRGLICVLLSITAVGLGLLASPAQSAVVRVSSVADPPANCETMWAVIATVWLPKQPDAVVNPTVYGCGSKFDAINWGRVVVDAFEAEVDPNKLQNLTMDVSGAFQEKLVPQITRHIGGDAGAFIETRFSKPSPRAWSQSATAYDQTLCRPVIATVPTNATVNGHARGD